MVVYAYDDKGDDSYKLIAKYDIIINYTIYVDVLHRCSFHKNNEI